MFLLELWTIWWPYLQIDLEEEFNRQCRATFLVLRYRNSRPGSVIKFWRHFNVLLEFVQFRVECLKYHSQTFETKVEFKVYIPISFVATKGKHHKETSIAHAFILIEESKHTAFQISQPAVKMSQFSPQSCFKKSCKLLIRKTSTKSASSVSMNEFNLHIPKHDLKLFVSPLNVAERRLLDTAPRRFYENK